MQSNIYRNLRYDWPLHVVRLVCSVLPDNVVFIRFRGFLYGLFLRSCGPRFGVGRNVVFYNPGNISIGSDVYIAQGTWISASQGVSIGDEVLFGPYVIVATTNHTKVDGSYRFGPPEGGEVVIKKGSWIGAHTTIGAGVTIGSGTAIGANSFVNKDIPNDVVAGGIPAKVVRKG